MLTMKFSLLNDQLARHINTTNMQWNLWYDTYLAYDLSKNTHYTIYTYIYIYTTQPATTQEHYHNRTQGLPKDFTPYGPKYNLMHVEHIFHNLVQSMTATANRSQTFAYALQIEDFNCRLLRFVTYSTVMQHIWFDPLKITVNQQRGIICILWGNNCTIDNSFIKASVFE